MQLIWIPQPVQKYCWGKTYKECSTIDYCIRTTDKHAAMCQCFSVDTTRLPAYPPDTTPRRVLSTSLFYPQASEKGFGPLAQFFEKCAEGFTRSFIRKGAHQSPSQVDQSAADDQFDMLEVLEVPVAGGCIPRWVGNP